MQYTISFQAQNLIYSLGGVRAELISPQKMLGSIGESLLRVNRDRHNKEQAPDGTPWKPLAKSTIHQMIEARQHKVTRVASGSRGARSSLSAARDVVASHKILLRNGDLLRFQSQVTGSQVVIGTGDKKAAWHHFGTGKYGPRGASYIISPVKAKALAFGGLVRKRVVHPGVPARSLVGFPDSDRRLVESVITDHISATINRLRK